MNNLVMDFYELTMGQVYKREKIENDIVYFDLFFRKCPDDASFAIANGIGECLDYLENFELSKSDIDYLKTLNIFDVDYLDFLASIKFTGDVWAVKDGSIVFPNEPIITLRAPIIEAQLVETTLLLLFNRASLITTKASRIVRSARGRSIMEFGSRRAQGETSAIYGAVDTYVAGAIGTACAETGKRFGIPVMGTMAHSLVQKFDTEYDAFCAYARTFPSSCILLIDTYDVIKSGVPNAIRVQEEVLKPLGSLAGVRIDSGDLCELSKKVRKMFDDAGLFDTKIIVSNSLDEYKIENLLANGAQIDSFGVGERMITSKSDPVFGGVYKLVAIEEKGKIIPKIKISEDEVKTTNPHFKSVFRVFDSEGMVEKDVIACFDEDCIFVEGKRVEKLNQLVMKGGKIIEYEKSIEQTRKFLNDNLKTLPEIAKQLKTDYRFVVDYTPKYKKIKEDLIRNV